MKSERKSEHRAYVYYFDWAEALLGMPDDIRLKIDDAIKRYALYGEEPNDPAIKYSIFALIRQQMDRNRKEYAERCSKISEMRSSAGQKGNEIRWGSSQTSQTSLDSDSDSITKEKSTNVDKKKTVHRFSPPSLSEVSDYIKEENYAVDPQRFIDFYTSIGWKVGKNKMKDWKAAVRNWEGRNKDNIPKTKEPMVKLSI